MKLPTRLANVARSHSLALATVAGAVIIATASFRSDAVPGNAAAVVAPTPANVGLVDLAKLMNNLQELKDRNDLTMGKGKQLQDKLGEISTQLKAIDAELKDVIPKDDKARRIEKVAQKFELEATFEARGKSYQRIIDLDHGDILNDLYPKAIAAIDAFAKM